MTLVSNDIQKAAEILANNELVAIPTETVYGLAANIFSESGIKKIFALKQRPLFNPLIVHTHSIEELDKFVSYIPNKAKLLAEKFWPGSLTMVLPKKSDVPDLVTAGKDTVGVRIPNHTVTLELLRNLDFPLAAPSANPFGSISPTTSTHVANYFKEGLQMVLEGGACQNGIESTIIGFENETPVLYRLGSISVEEIEAVVGDIAIKNNKEAAPDAPGMLSRHYAPDTTTYLVNDVASFASQFPNKKVGVLLFNQNIEANNIKHIETLSISGNLKEATAKLYATLHKLDTLDLDIIIAEKFPDYGLGKSINDRLLRATKK
ncbi:L-threonylcarbamoyladenylate synthase [Flavicella marina]|uniref:L-threonylcarbamoyladenylate synthase n=1 Tax=Flavicella marina TaxID=1475951 RepID=UPI001264D31A|nr:L-threonylcarbamoyladenylate synthase [Flavicella marina]